MSTVAQNTLSSTAATSTSSGSFKFVVPGERIVRVSDDVRPGIGTYELYGYINASLAGIVHHVPHHEGEKDLTTIEVRRSSDIEKRHIMPYVGCIVTARVLNIGPRYLKCAILCVDSSILAHEFSGLLRKEDIVEFDKQKVQIEQCFHPGDIILARVIGFGETQKSFVLSTAEDQLGVVNAIGEYGERMVPCSFTEVKSVLTGVKESRKVARVPCLNG
ncbi:hypothetical protein AB6A40_001079 [Gnathostoma spinigerum]|uniref:Uncharacterized protein n=1 Tax=Gnathostoma spinigerum TaxID=75299 RepID=A0ABD6EDH9_9BILA